MITSLVEGEPLALAHDAFEPELAGASSPFSAMHRAALGVAADALSGRYGHRDSGGGIASSHGLPKGIFWEDRCCKNRAKSLIYLERAKGIEPSTYSLGSCRSTTELRPRTEVSPGRARRSAPAPQDNAKGGRGKAGTASALALRRACFTLATISDHVS